MEDSIHVIWKTCKVSLRIVTFKTISENKEESSTSYYNLKQFKKSTATTKTTPLTKSVAGVNPKQEQKPHIYRRVKNAALQNWYSANGSTTQ